MDKNNKSKTNWSLFPSARHIIDEYERRQEDTLKIEPGEELIEASQRNRKVFCDKCGKVDETGLDWTKISLLNDDDTNTDIWYCDKCLIKKLPNTSYTYLKQDIPHAEEKITIPDFNDPKFQKKDKKKK